MPIGSGGDGYAYEEFGLKYFKEFDSEKIIKS